MSIIALLSYIYQHSFVLSLYSAQLNAFQPEHKAIKAFNHVFQQTHEAGIWIQSRTQHADWKNDDGASTTTVAKR